MRIRRRRAAPAATGFRSNRRARSQPGDSKQWAYTAPPGTRIKQVSRRLQPRRRPRPGREPLVPVHPPNRPVAAGEPVGGRPRVVRGDLRLVASGPRPTRGGRGRRLLQQGRGTCGYAPDQFARMSAATFLMEDTVGAGGAGRRRSRRRRRMGRRDDAARRRRDRHRRRRRPHDHSVDGQQVLTDTICEPGQDANGYVGTMAPCDPIELRYLGLDTADPGFTRAPTTRSGSVRTSTDSRVPPRAPSRSCGSTTSAPAAPLGLSVVGGDGWHRDNEFELTLGQPAAGPCPDRARRVRQGPGRTDDDHDKIGAGIEAIDGLAVPAVGEYTASVYLRDAAGNESPTDRR